MRGACSLHVRTPPCNPMWWQGLGSSSGLPAEAVACSKDRPLGPPPNLVHLLASYTPSFAALLGLAPVGFLQYLQGAAAPSSRPSPAPTCPTRRAVVGEHVSVPEESHRFNDPCSQSELQATTSASGDLTQTLCVPVPAAAWPELPL